MKILLLEKDFDIRNLLNMYLDGIFDEVEILEEKNARLGIEILEKMPDINFVICDFDLEEGKGHDVFNKMQAIHHKAFFILTVDRTFDKLKHLFNSKPPHIVLKPYQLGEMREHILAFNSTNQADYQMTTLPLENGNKVISLDKKISGYCKIRPVHLQKLLILPADIFVAISSDKMIKVMCKGDYFESTDAIHYQMKNIKYLYLRDKDFFNILVNLETDLKKLLRLTSLMDKDPLAIPSSAHEMARECLAKFGFSQYVQDIVKDSVELTLKTIKIHPNLSEIFEKVKEYEGHYLSTHSILLAHVSCAISAEMKWLSPSTYQKLCMASFMHDIVLEDYNLEKISELDKKCTLSLDSEEGMQSLYGNAKLLYYYNHPMKAAELFNTMSESMPDVDIIISQHHELPNGKGFPRRLDALSMSPLSCIMILSHEIVDDFLRDSSKFELVNFINKLDPSYTRGNFKSVIKALTEMHF